MSQIDVLNHALQIIDAPIDCWTAPALAKRLGYSRSHLDSLFTHWVGESLGSYIRRRRLDWAADELASGQRRIIEVALDAGYDSQEAFARAFERRYGRTPGEFRRLGRPRVLRPQLSVQPHDKWPGRMRLIMVWHVRLNREVSS